jgi:hypothetical protein
VDFRSPERFIGIDVSNTTERALVEDRSLDLSSLTAKSSDHISKIEVSLEWVRGNMTDRIRDSVATLLSESIHAQPTECTLVEEVESEFLALASQSSTHPYMRMSWLLHLMTSDEYPELTTHSEMSDQYMLIPPESDPQELSTASYLIDGEPLQ